MTATVSVDMFDRVEAASCEKGPFILEYRNRPPGQDQCPLVASLGSTLAEGRTDHHICGFID